MTASDNQHPLRHAPGTVLPAMDGVKRAAQLGTVARAASDDYGMEAIVDLHDCDVALFTRTALDKFLEELCKRIDMQRATLYWWDYAGDQRGYTRDTAKDPHLVGTSCVQFITTSAVVIHTIDPWRKLFLNVFSCKTFDAREVRDFAADYFKGTVAGFRDLTRR